MPEKGYFHPDRGYWQATDEPPDEILAGYPDGTVEVPLQPSPNHVWENGQWVDRGPAPPSLDSAITNAPDDLTGGPTLAEIFGATI